MIMYLITYFRSGIYMKNYLITLSLILVLTLAACGSDTETSNEAVDEEKKTIEVDETIIAADYTVKIRRAKINDDILTIAFEWVNQSDWDPAHFELLGIIDVQQDGESLEEIEDDRKYKQIKQNIYDVYDLQYKLRSESDVTIRIIPNNEYDEERQITVSLE